MTPTAERRDPELVAYRIWRSFLPTYHSKCQGNLQDRCPTSQRPRGHSRLRRDPPNRNSPDERLRRPRRGQPMPRSLCPAMARWRWSPSKTCERAGRRRMGGKAGSPAHIETHVSCRPPSPHRRPRPSASSPRQRTERRNGGEDVLEQPAHRHDRVQIAISAKQTATCPLLGPGIPAFELCWNLGDAVIRRRSVLACR